MSTSKEIKTGFSVTDFMKSESSQRGGEASIYKASIITEMIENGQSKKAARKKLRDFFVKSAKKWQKDPKSFNMVDFRKWCDAVYIGNVFYTGSEISDKLVKDFTAEILKK